MAPRQNDVHVSLYDIEAIFFRNTKGRQVVLVELAGARHYLISQWQLCRLSPRMSILAYVDVAPSRQSTCCSVREASTE